MRQAHWLKANKKGELPSHIICYDTETKSISIGKKTSEARLWFGWACYSRRTRGNTWSKPVWWRFETRAGFWHGVKKRAKSQRKLYLFAHNASFDLTVLGWLEHLIDKGWKTRRAILEGPPWIVTARKGKATIELLCTLNYFRSSLEELGKSLGIPKLPMPKAEQTRKEWDSYCKRDVEVVYRAMLAFLAFIVEHDLGNFQPTIAGQAFNAYRHRFMDNPIYIDDSTSSLELARAGYLGGRTEAFRLGKLAEPMTLLDINSQYPAAMKGNLFPARLMTCVSRISPEEVREWLKRWVVMADVEIATKDPAYPLVLEGRLVFPVGRFRTILATPELTHALDRGRVRRVFKAACYLAAPLFNSYVDYFHRLKGEYGEAGNKPFRHMVKIFLNSLYGKWGQSGRHFERIGDAETSDPYAWIEIDANTGEARKLRNVAGEVQELASLSEARNSHPAIAAHVTSAARIQLWGLIEKAGRENVYYTDTDSLLVNTEGRQRLQDEIVPGVLGKLEVEGEFTEGHLYGLKDYKLGDRVKMKGIRRNAIKIGPNTYRQDTFIGVKGMIKMEDMSKQRIRVTEKTLKRVYLKGDVSPEGIVTPFHLPRLETKP